MPLSRSLLALAAAASTASAAYQGFNYGSTFTDGSAKMQSDFEADFKNAAGLDGTHGAFTSARFYTMIQANTANDPLQAIPAGVDTKTSMLFTLWASAGQDAFNNELAALKNTISQYCSGGLGPLVAGISVGSEDLYRITPTGIANHENPGVGPDVLVSYIKQVRSTIKGSCLGSTPVGHVDTWTAYVNGSNSALIDAADWLGMDTYPYYQTTDSNSIDNAKNLFQSAFEATQGAAGGKPVWITETGWPVSGKKSAAAVASTENARTYWKEVGCPLFGNTNTWWFTMQDAAPTTPNPSFGLIGSTLTEKPVYDLSCDGVSTGSGSSGSSSSSKSSMASKPTSTSAEAQASSSASSGSGSGSGSGSSGSNSGSGSGAYSESSSAVVTVIASTGIASASSNGSSSAMMTSAVAAPSMTPSSGMGSGSGSNGTAPSSTMPGSGSGSPTTTPVPAGSGNRLNSFGAAVVALLLTVIVL